MTLSEYINRINKRYKTGISREHAYRGDLQNLLEGMPRNVLVTNEPARPNPKHGRDSALPEDYRGVVGDRSDNGGS